MRRYILLLFCTFQLTIISAQQTFHNFTVISITGDTVPLSQYYGKKVLVVNTASYCGYTYQFGMLQALDSIYSNNNFEVVGFPSNDFGGQDPYADSTIATFCTGVYGVTFQMMSKVSITASDTADLYKWLQRQDLNGVANAPVTWNFNKYGIDEAGHWVHHFDSPVTPLDTAITNWILTPSVVTNVQQNESSNPVTVLMNSTSSLIQITSNAMHREKLTVTLLNIQGQEIASIYNGEINGTYSINYSLSAFNKGIYIVRSVIGNRTLNTKVIAGF